MFQSPIKISKIIFGFPLVFLPVSYPNSATPEKPPRRWPHFFSRSRWQNDLRWLRGLDSQRGFESSYFADEKQLDLTYHPDKDGEILWLSGNWRKINLNQENQNKSKKINLNQENHNKSRKINLNQENHNKSRKVNLKYGLSIGNREINYGWSSYCIKPVARFAIFRFWIRYLAGWVGGIAGDRL